MEKNLDVKYMILLGKVGGAEEYKKNSMRETGIHAPNSFNDLPAIPEPEMNAVPASRRSKEFICTISDDRGEECTQDFQSNLLQYLT